MPSASGSIAMNGINDPELIKILQAKAKDPDVGFNPQVMQAIQVNEGGQKRSFYNNVMLTWSSGNGLKTVRDILTELLA